MINNIFSLENVFQEIYYRIGNRINEGSCWILELIESQDLHISNYRPLSGNSYVQLPVELTSSKKGLINIKNNGQKCLLGCHLRHVNPVKVHPERITQTHKKLANNLNYGGVELPVWGKDFSKNETKDKICIVLDGEIHTLACFHKDLRK